MPRTVPDPISLSPRVVVFDYGEVISHAPTEADRTSLVERASVPREPFWTAYWAHRDGLDQGTVSIAEYWELVAREVGANWGPVDVHELWAIDHRSWLSVNADTLAVLHALVAGGTRIALLSNAGADFTGWLRFGSFSPLFEQVFVSGEIGLVKPHAAIYRHVMHELGITPAEFVFVDNKPGNAEGAVAVGGAGHVFTDAATLESWLRGLAS